MRNPDHRPLAGHLTNQPLSLRKSSVWQQASLWRRSHALLPGPVTSKALWLRSGPHRGGRWALVAVWLLLTLMPAAVQAGDVQDPCREGNLIANCRFDDFSGASPRQVPAGWTPFIVSGDLTFMQDTDTYFGPPSLRMWSNGGTFTAGIYTQVGGLQPGAAYVASWGWGGPNDPDSFGRKLGIDPTGGVDPLAPSVIWGPLHYGPGRFLSYTGPYSPDNPNVSVSAVAQSSTVTVFVWVEHPRSTGDNLIYIDNVGLHWDANQPPPTPTAVPATATPAPPVARAQAAATSAPSNTPTATPAPTDTPSPTPSPSPTATETPSPTATPTATASPTTTPTPTLTPTATPTRPPRPTATPPSLFTQVEQTATRQPALLLYTGMVSLAGAAGLGGLIWLQRRRNA